MSNLYLIFNHTFTDLQKHEAKEFLSVEKIIDMPLNLKKLWRDVPPDLSEIKAYLGPIKKWLGDYAQPADYVFVEGDFGATFTLVRFALDMQLVPIYSTTHRHAVEEHLEGDSVKLTHHFKHYRFRKYGA